METIILAGGFGTRLSHIVSDVPKPMAPVANRPFLEYILEDYVAQGITKIILAVGYKYEIIQAHFGEEFHGVPLSYSIEDTPLFTGGAIQKAMSLSTEKQVFVVNGDTYFPVDLKEMYQKFLEMGKNPLISVKKIEDTTRYGAVTFSETGEISVLSEKNQTGEGYINGGVYLLPNKSLMKDKTSFSLENEIFPKWLAEKKLFALESNAFFIDIGIEADYLKAQTIFQEVPK